MEAIEKGDYVKVSDGQPEPPKHHQKKHRHWGYRNFFGWVYRVEDSCGYITVSDTQQGSAVVFSFPARMVTKVDIQDGRQP